MGLFQRLAFVRRNEATIMEMRTREAKRDALLLASICAWMREVAVPVPDAVVDSVMKRQMVKSLVGLGASDSGEGLSKLMNDKSIVDWRLKQHPDTQDPFVYRILTEGAGAVAILSNVKDGGENPLRLMVVMDTDATQVMARPEDASFTPKWEQREMNKAMKRLEKPLLDMFVRQCPNGARAWRTFAADHPDHAAGQFNQRHTAAWHAHKAWLQENPLE